MPETHRRGAEPHGTSQLTTAQLTTAQREIFFDQLLDPEAPIYNIAGCLRVDGPVDVERLRRAFAHVASRRDALRLRLRHGEPPTQEIAPEAPPLGVVDLRRLEAPEHAAEQAQRLLAARPFVLDGGHLCRFALLRLETDAHRWLASYHHATIDGWGIALMTRDLVASYNALESATDRQHSTGPLHSIASAPSCLALLETDHSYRASAAFARDRGYWSELLAVPPAPLLAPGHSLASQRFTLVLGRPLYRRLTRVAQRRGGLFPFFLAAFYTLLRRVHKQDDLALGIATLNRRGPLKNTVGLCAGIVPLRVDTAPRATLGELLRLLPRRLRAAYRAQRFPLGEIARQLASEQDGRPRLFDVLVSYEPHDYPERLGGHPTSVTTIPTGADRHPLSIFVREYAEEGDVRIDLDHQLAALDTVGIRRFAARLHVVLGALAEALEQDTDPALDALPVLTAAERHQAMVEWNATSGTPWPMPVSHTADTLDHLVRAQAKRTPESIALEHGSRRLTYAELEHHVEALASELAEHGVGPETRVGLCTERSPEMIVGLLAILTAGGTYVPLDPSYPAERLAFTLDDAAITVLLVAPGLDDHLPSTPMKKLELSLGGSLQHSPPWKRGVGEDSPARRAAAASCPDNLAYLIYTSGSTGRPKGVALTHRGAIALVYWAHRAFDRVDFDGVLGATSINWDLSIFEIFATLTCGGRLVLVGSALDLAELESADGVRLVNTVPSAMAEVLRRDAVPASVRTINLAGEPLRPALVDALLQRSPKARVFDLYGPSEDTTYTTWTRRTLSGPQTIGRPLPGTRILLLGRCLEPVPPGADGELFVAGVGLARGYLARPSLSAASFIPDPFSGRHGPPGGRLYRTGDLARHRPEGRLVFLGRGDQQVKVRGFRIELGEVEAALEKLPNVTEAAATVRDTKGRRRLVAWVVASSATDLSSATGPLRRELGRSLPPQMVPSAIMGLDRLPRLPNGKLDRSALESLELADDGSTATADSAGVAPQGETERLVAALWAELLGVDHVAANESFFALGGDSLLASRAIGRVRQSFGVELPLRRLFEHPTVAALASEIRAARGVQPPAFPPLLDATVGTESTASEDDTAPLALAQERLWLLHRLDPRSPVYNLAGALHLRGHLDTARLRGALNALVRRHGALRTTFTEMDDGPEQKAAAAAETRVHLPTVDLEALPSTRREAVAGNLARRQGRQPFALERGPLAKFHLLRLADDVHRLVVVLHHTVADGWSLGIVLRELAALYGDHDQPLAAPEITYAAYARWQRRAFDAQSLDALLGPWRERLASVEPLELPADRPRPATFSYRGRRLQARWLAPLAGQLEALGRQHGTTFFMTLLAGFQTVLGRWSGQTGFAVATPVAGRPHPALEAVVGCFVNTLPLLADFRGRPSFAELLARARRVTLDAHDGQDAPFEKIVEALGGARDPGRVPLAQAMLVLQNTPSAQPRLGCGEQAIEGQVEIVDTGTAKFDLLLEVQPKAADGSLEIALEIATDLFEVTTARRLIEHLHTLFQAAARSPGVRAAELPLLPDAERHQLLHSWNDTARPPHPEALLHGPIAKQAARTPDAIALSWETEDDEAALTYAELWRRARGLARHLRAAGVGPEAPVAICAERSPELLVGLLGILEAGGAYVPLDPEHPRERIAYMVESSGAALVVAQERWRDQLPEGVPSLWLPLSPGESGSRSPCPTPPTWLISFIPRARQDAPRAP